MKKILLATAAVACLASAAPASAQVGYVLRQAAASIFGGRSNSYDNRINELNNRLQYAYQRGEISRSDFARLQYELRDIAQREQSNRYRDGLSQSERDDLHWRLQNFESHFQQVRAQGNGRAYGDRDYHNYPGGRNDGYQWDNNQNHQSNDSDDEDDDDDDRGD